MMAPRHITAAEVGKQQKQVKEREIERECVCER